MPELPPVCARSALHLLHYLLRLPQMAAIMRVDNHHPRAHGKTKQTDERIPETKAVQVEPTRFLNERSQFIVRSHEGAQHFLPGLARRRPSLFWRLEFPARRRLHGVDEPSPEPPRLDRSSPCHGFGIRLAYRCPQRSRIDGVHLAEMIKALRHAPARSVARLPVEIG